MKTSSGHFWGVPATAPGRWSAWLGLVFVLMFIGNVFINLYFVRPADEPGVLVFYWLFVILMLVCGLAGGLLGLVALMKQHERSSLVWLAVCFALFVLALVLNEILQGIEYFAGA
jgi:hypothetical protein